MRNPITGYRMLLSAICFLTVFMANGQAAQALVFGQKCYVGAFAGQTVAVQAMVKTRQLEKGAGAGLLLKVQHKNNKPVTTLFSPKPVTKDSWTLCTLKLKLDKDADSLSVGGIVMGAGLYGFDDFRATVGNTSLMLHDQGFESGKPEGYWKFPFVPKGFKYGFEGDSSTANHYLMIDASASSKTTGYGNDEKAGKFADVNGVRLYYETYGSGAPLVLLHGNQQSIGVFAAQIREFAKFYKVIAVDTRGQGRSTEDGTPYTYDLFAEDTKALLDHLQLDSAYVVGWSDGGNTGLILATKYPQKVKKLVTMGACAFIDKTVVSNKVFKIVEQRIRELASDTSSMAQNSKRLYTLLLTEPKHRFEDLGKINCPVLVMAGEADIIKEAHTKGIAANIAKAELYIAPKKTHEFPVEDPAGFNQKVLDFLQQDGVAQH